MTEQPTNNTPAPGGGSISIAPGGEAVNMGGAMRVDAGGTAVSLGGAQFADPAAKEAEAPTPAPEAAKEDAQPKAPEDKAPPEPQPTPEPEDPRLVPYTEEFTKNGELSKESLEKAAKEFGVPLAIVQAYVDGLKAQTAMAQAQVSQTQAEIDAQLAQEVAEIHASVGGKEAWEGFAKWTAEGLSPEDQQTLQEAIDSGKKNVRDLVVKSMFERYQASGAIDNRRDLTSGAANGGAGAQTNAGFKSLAEQSAALNDPRYSKDPTYRDEVNAKIAITRL